MYKNFKSYFYIYTFALKYKEAAVFSVILYSSTGKT